MAENWQKETARDIIALGSIPFYVIVVIRAIVGQYTPFVSHLLISLIVLVILWGITRKASQHIARAFVLVVYTSFFYGAALYAIFAALLWVSMLFSSHYLKVKSKEIALGALFGVVAVAAGYYFTLFLV